jgi:putative transposase
MAARIAGEGRVTVSERRSIRSTFLRNHARVIVACDFFVSVTATVRLLYGFVVIEHGARRLLHLNVTAHPTAAWTLQQLREALGYEDRYRYLIHDRDGIVSKSLDESNRTARP